MNATIQDSLSKSRAILDRIDGLLKCRHGVLLSKPHECAECVKRAREFDCDFVTWNKPPQPTNVVTFQPLSPA